MILEILKKEIDLDNSPILFDQPVTAESLKKDWDIHHSEWWVEDGWLTGKNPGNHPGMVILKQDFPGNVLVEFEARTVLPSTRDINFMWNGSWDDVKDQRGMAYVAGLQGWWGGKVGIEKSPEYKLNATTPLFDFQPGKIYHIQGGSVEGHCFVFVDGKLLLEVTDPDPIDSQKHTKVGFEAYCSFIQVRNIRIRSICWKHKKVHYEPEF
ncbi:MAG: hypothetical protein GX066_07280 [Clostridiaceae bacterium]|nr:hypothetical protein [Clostridiaceae bacterium]